MFHKYQHIERLGTPGVDGILDGLCYVFPKIDGTNASVWVEGYFLCCGSRNRELSKDNDNHGFYSAIALNDNIRNLLLDNPYLRLYGEWLIPHSLKTYRESAWRKFYVFDVCEYSEETGLRYLPYPEYAPMLDEFSIDYIQPLAVITNPTEDALVNVMKRNTYLIEDGKGVGEGIVIKNYDFVNRFGRVTWAKMVTSEFKEKQTREMGAPQQTCAAPVEEKLAAMCISQAIVDKAYYKLIHQGVGKLQPALLESVWHDVVCEELYPALRKLKNPTVDFKRLHRFVVARTKQFKPEIF